MSVVGWAAIIFGVLAVALVLFARYGRMIRNHRTGDAPAAAENLVQHAPEVLKALGMRVESTNTLPDGITEIAASREGPLVDQRVCVRIMPNNRTLVSAGQVRSAATVIRNAGFDRGVIVSPGGFSHEAHIAAQDGGLDLLTAMRWAELDAVLARNVVMPRVVNGESVPLLS